MTDKTDWDAKAREIANTGTYHNAQAKETHVLRMARRIAQALRNADLRCAVRVVKARKAGIAEERERVKLLRHALIHHAAELTRNRYAVHLGDWDGDRMARWLGEQADSMKAAAIRSQPDEQEKIEPAHDAV